MPAAVLGPIIGGVGSIVGGIMGGNAAKKAADAQAKAAQAAADISKQNAGQAQTYNNNIYNQQQQTAAPWINTGQSAIARAGQLMGLGPPPGGGASRAALDPNAAGTINNPSVRSAGQLNNTNLNPWGISDLSLGSGNATAVNNTAHEVTPGMAGYGKSYQDMQKPPVAGMRFGGRVQGPGTSTSDSVPIKASKGEFIVRADVANQPGVMQLLTHLNRGGKFGGTHFAAGGVVDATAGNQMAQVPPGVMIPNGQGATNSMMPPDPSAGFDPNATVGGPGIPNPSGDGSTVLPPQGSAPGTDGSFGSLTQGYGAFNAPTGVDESNDPGYAFRLQQGQQALERSAAARGGVLNGGTLKALNDYAQNSASGEYSNVYNRALSTYGTNQGNYNTNQNNLYNRLMGISGSGQLSAGQLGQEGTAAAGNNSNVLMTSAGQQGQDLTNAGTARASGYVGAANAYGSILPNVGGALSAYALARKK
jgi:hypothetical protein